jgi:hypothetical protein
LFPGRRVILTLADPFGIRFADLSGKSTSPDRSVKQGIETRLFAVSLPDPLVNHLFDAFLYQINSNSVGAFAHAFISASELEKPKHPACSADQQGTTGCRESRTTDRAVFSHGQRLAKSAGDLDQLHAGWDESGRRGYEQPDFNIQRQVKPGELGDDDPSGRADVGTANEYQLRGGARQWRGGGIWAR